jgi:hypothetical protein
MNVSPSSPARASSCQNPYQPVGEGHAWTYKSTSSSANQQNTTVKQKITSVSAASFTTTSTYYGLSVKAIWRCTPKGLVAQSFGAGPTASIYTVGYQTPFVTTATTGVTLPSNPQPGQTWTQTFTLTSTTGGSPQQLKVNYKAVSMSVANVPAGGFQAIEITASGALQGNSFTFTGWYARGVGLVKSTATAQYQGKNATSELDLSNYSAPTTSASP